MRHSFGDDSHSDYEQLDSTLSTLSDREVSLRRPVCLPAQCALRRQHHARAQIALELSISPSQTQGDGITSIMRHLPSTSLQTSAHKNQT